MISNGNFELFHILAIDFPWGKRNVKINIRVHNSDMETHNNEKTRTS